MLEENVTMTNPDGSFSITGSAEAVANAIMVLTPDLGECADVGTGTILAIKMMGPPRSTALSPMSTLMVSVMLAGNLTQEEGDDKVCNLYIVRLELCTATI